MDNPFKKDMKDSVSKIPLDVKPARILLIEDSESDVFLFKMMLEDDFVLSRRYEITDVSKVTDAFKALAKDEFDLIILDLNLLDMHGITSVRVLHDEVPDVPIIVYSGMDSDALRRSALDHGATRYVVKGTESVAAMKRYIDDALSGVSPED